MKTPATLRALLAMIITAPLWLAAPAHAVTYTTAAGTSPDFPDGDISFADAVIAYDPGTAVGEPTEPFKGSFNALGIPDVTTAAGFACFNFPSQANCPFVSLGVGGSLTVEFIDNRLTGSDDAGLDLWIFEVGPDIEDTFVEISKDGLVWSDVGMVTGSTKGVDIDAFGFGSADVFRFVRLTDDPFEGETDGPTVGADIDAIGAISNLAVPLPPVALLFPSGLLAGLAWMRRRR